ncbi:MAG TPA: cupin domain-containing protein [Anaerolineae bacterium]|nr:cupin domain-containing protein [Anaerolineae bacterium]
MSEKANQRESEAGIPQPTSNIQNELWEPEPIPAADFYRPGEWANINRAPYDQVSGVTYKRAAHIKRVMITPDAASEAPALWQARGTTVVRWLFSELAGTEEHLLAEATFAFLHDVRLLPGAATPQSDHPGEMHVLYGVAGCGMVCHRSQPGSPVLARPLRPGDAVLIRGTEYYNIVNEGVEEVRLIVLGLYQP